MGDGDKTAMKDRDEGFGLAAFLVAFWDPGAATSQRDKFAQRYASSP